MYCISGENMVYQSVRVRCAGVCITIEWGQDQDMKEFTVTDKNGEKRVETLLILGLGLVAFVMDTVGGVMIAKLMNLFLKEKINPMIGAAGISAFPMSARVVHKMGLAEDKQNYLLMQAIGVNVSGQIASVVAGGLILNFFL